jgi:hypothetical protein
MESCSDYPHTKAWEPPPIANILSSHKPPTHHIQFARKASLKKTPPNGGRKSVNTKSSIWLQTKAFHRRTNIEFYNVERAAFLDTTQAVDKVWHTELLCKLKISLPLNYFLILKSDQ